MIWLKACPRCKVGALYLEEDAYGKYKECLQCGYIKDLVDENAPAPKTMKELLKDRAANRSLVSLMAQGPRFN